MNDFIKSMKERDPAAKSTLSVILTYPGVKAVFLHQIAHFFHVAGFDLIARIISQTSRFNVFEDQEVFQSLPDFADWPTFPQIYFNSELVGGGDIIIEMAEQDTLKDAMQEALEKFNN